MNNMQGDLQNQQLKLDYLSAQKATKEFYNNKNMNTGRPANKYTTKYDEVRIRLAQIDNYNIKRDNTFSSPLDTDHVLNMKTGKVTLRWMYYPGGDCRSDEYGYPSEGFDEDWKYDANKDVKNPEERTLDCYNHDKASNKETVPLTHSFIWSNSKNWCGTNYLPPVGSVVIVGFAKNNIPYILGYLQTNYEICKPYLKPGEILTKGYGNNYIHWRQSNKLDIFAGSNIGEVDLDDPDKIDTYEDDIELWERFDTFTRDIFIDAVQKNKYRTNIRVSTDGMKFTSEKLNTGEKSHITILPNNIIMESKSISGTNANFNSITCGTLNASNINYGRSARGNLSLSDLLDQMNETIEKQNKKIAELEKEIKTLKGE